MKRSITRKVTKTFSIKSLPFWIIRMSFKSFYELTLRRLYSPSENNYCLISANLLSKKLYNNYTYFKKLVKWNGVIIIVLHNNDIPVCSSWPKDISNSWWCQTRPQNIFCERSAKSLVENIFRTPRTHSNATIYRHQNLKTTKSQQNKEFS